MGRRCGTGGLAVAAVLLALAAPAAAQEACPAKVGAVSGLPSAGGSLPNGYLLVNGKVPKRRHAPSGPGFRVRARPGQVLSIDFPLTACASGGGTWWENDPTLWMLTRRGGNAGPRALKVVGSSGIAPASAIPEGVQWPYGQLAAGGWGHRVVRIQPQRRGRFYLVAGFGSAGWFAPGASPPADPDALSAVPSRAATRGVYTVEVVVSGPAGKVFAQTCARTAQRLLIRRPARRGHPRRRGCSPRRRLRGAEAMRALAQPAAPRPPGGGVPPALAGCLLTPDADATGPGEWLLSRRSWCSAADILQVRSLVVVLTPSSRSVITVGTGVLAVNRRIDLAAGGNRFAVGLGYLGLSGEILGGAVFELDADCAFAFDTRCAALPDGGLPPRPFIRSGTTSAAGWQLAESALPGGSQDFMDVALTIKVKPLLSERSFPVTLRVNPRPRCDTKLTPRQACVFGSFRPTVAYSRAAIPEISAHIARALAAGRPGALHRARSGIAARRRAACPPAVVKRFRRARPGGSCDEYPFASTSEGGGGASIANVPAAEQRSQGGLMSGFYSSQRMLDGDAFRVAVGP